MSAPRYQNLSITLPSSMAAEVSSLGAKESRSRSEIVREALRLYLTSRTAVSAGNQPATGLLQYLGAGKGIHKTPAAANRAVRELRSEWRK